MGLTAGITNLSQEMVVVKENALQKMCSLFIFTIDVTLKCILLLPKYLNSNLKLSHNRHIWSSVSTCL